MRDHAMIAAVLASMVAAPAAARERAPFAGAHVEILAGDDNLGEGFAYGGAIGYDVQAGRVVIGVEGDVSDSTAAARRRNVLARGDELHVFAQRDLYAAARVGYVVSPVAMVYVKAGYTNARIGGTYRRGGMTIAGHEDLEGYRIGAGAEYLVRSRLYVKGEYRFADYANSTRYDFDATRHQILGGIGLKF